MEDENDYEKTLLWALEEEKLRTNRGKGVSSFYLYLISLIIFIVFFLILYFDKEKKINPIDMMKDPENIYDEYTEDGELMEIIDEEEKEILDEEPKIDDVIESK